MFVRTKRGADRLVKRLASNSVKAVAMHGDKSQGQRERALASFESGAVDTLVATDVAARGIDVAGITHVINYDMPGTREDYVHRIGRTARAGASGVGVTLVTHDQARELSVMVGDLGLHRELELGGLPSDATGQRAGSRSAKRARRSGRREGGAPGQPQHDPDVRDARLRAVAEHLIDRGEAASRKPLRAARRYSRQTRRRSPPASRSACSRLESRRSIQADSVST